MSLTWALAFPLLSLLIYSPIFVAATGTLRCAGGQTEYQINFSFTDPKTKDKGIVENVRVGSLSRARPECSARPFPAFGLQTGFSVKFSYGQCDQQAQEANDDLTLSSIALIDVRFAGPLGLKRYQIGLKCVAHLGTSGNVQMEYPEPIVIQLPGSEAFFGIKFSLNISQAVRPQFGNTGETNVHIFSVELDAAFRATHTLIADRCWATATAAPDIGPRYDFISSVSCNEIGTDYVTHRREDSYRQVFEVAGFEFEVPTSTVYFHCDVKICTAGGDQTRCSESCPLTGASSKLATNSDFRLGSGVIHSNPDVPVYVTVSAQNGAPILAVDRPFPLAAIIAPVGIAAGVIVGAVLGSLAAVGVVGLTAVAVHRKISGETPAQAQTDRPNTPQMSRNDLTIIHPIHTRTANPKRAQEPSNESST
ncbi:hypothetical protein BV898_01134 [Hypsibius exemplaris]|uniref:ZP domain-containing protein n=1 Tax=Hypsibius exemplaris TaxID=2072580 RepID=A0A1W0XBW5_HYPEX|nr:hypothetical protein BV898_01134 [Hypsibius exemplaris]